MAERWKRIGILGGVLFGLNVVGRLVSKFGFDKNESKQTLIGFATLGAVAVAIGIMAFVWGRGRSVGVVVADLAGATIIGCLLSMLIGPFLIGGKPFANGAGDFFSGIWWYVAFAAVGAFIGLAILIALGRDLRSRQLKNYSARVKRV